MNQILLTNIYIKFKKKTYLVQFFIVVFFAFCLIVNLFWKKYSKKNEQNISEITSKKYSLARLYQRNHNNNILLNGNLIPIIGTIEIPKINISYPIFSECSDELLKISVCRFYGPYPNQIGNLCIAGHNYDNGTFFSNLFFLNTYDKINVYDNYSRKIVYSIYNIYEINPNDLSCISQDTSRSKRNNSYHM